jgi:hypothetical protein
MLRWRKPTQDTKFCIDFDWWEQAGRDLRVQLHQHLCSSCRADYPTHVGSEQVDWIDPDTAEVQPVDGLWHKLRSHCSLQSDYVREDMPVTDAVFRVFLANGNAPLTPVELAAKIRQPPEKILRVLGHGRIYAGIRPCLEV